MNGSLTKMACSWLVAAGVLSACSLECDFYKNDLEAAATLPHSGGGYNPLPRDVWTTNPELEAFLRTVLQTEGAGALSAKYGLQCAPSDSACVGCVTCRKTIKEWRMRIDQLPLPMYACVDYGEVLVQADVGPGSAVKAMTYWKTTPEAREVLARPKVPVPVAPGLPQSE